MLEITKQTYVHGGRPAQCVVWRVKDPPTWELALTQPKCLSVCICLQQKCPSEILKSCLDIFLACLFLSRQGLSDCLPAASFNSASIEINVCRPRLWDGSKITQCVSHLTSALFEHWSSSSTVCICQALAMHLFPYFTPSTPCCECILTGEGQNKVEMGTCHGLKKWSCNNIYILFFSSRVKMMVWCGSTVFWCQVECKLYCNSRTVMPNIIVASSLSSLELGGIYSLFGHILGFCFGRCQEKCNSHHEAAQRKLQNAYSHFADAKYTNKHCKVRCRLKMI